MEIIAGTPQDAAELAQVASIIWHETYVPINGLAHVEYMLAQFQSPQAFTSQMTTGGYRYWLLKDHDKIVGYLGYQEKPDEIFLSKIYLLKEYRGQGLAQKLFALLPTHLPIRLTVNKHNLQAKARYEKWGFQVVESVVTDIGSGYVMDDYVLVKPAVK